jgi:hypothetical protein
MALAINYGSKALNSMGGGGHSQRIKITGCTVPATGSGEGELHTAASVAIDGMTNTYSYGILNVEGAKSITVWIRNTHATLNANVYAYASLLRGYANANDASEFASNAHAANEWTNIPYDPDGNAYVTVAAGATGYFLITGQFCSLKFRGVSSDTAFTAGLDIYVELTY